MHGDKVRSTVVSQSSDEGVRDELTKPRPKDQKQQHSVERSCENIEWQCSCKDERAIDLFRDFHSLAKAQAQFIKRQYCANCAGSLIYLDLSSSLGKLNQHILSHFSLAVAKI